MSHSGTKHDYEMMRTIEEPATTDLTNAELPDNFTVRQMRLVWEKRRILARATVIALVVGTLLAFLLPSRFESTTRLMPPDQESNPALTMLAALSGKAGGLGTLAGDLLGVKNSGALFIGVLQSRTVEEALVREFDLRHVYGYRLEEKARHKLEENTAISEDRKSGIIAITVTDGDPHRAAAMAKAYVNELNALVVQLSTSSARREREFLEQRLQKVQADLEKAEKEFGQYASKNSTLDIKEQAKAMVNAAATLQGQLIAAQSELEGLKQIYTDNNVRVRAAKARIAELQNQIAQVGGQPDAAAASPSSQNERPYPSIRELPLLGVGYADLYRRTRVEEAAFEALSAQYELAKVQEAKETPSVKVLDEAEVPERRSFPPRLLIITLSVFLGVLFSITWILVEAGWEQVEPRDPRKVLAREVYETFRAHIPWGANGSNSQAGSRRIWSRLNWRQGTRQPEDTEKER